MSWGNGPSWSAGSSSWRTPPSTSWEASTPANETSSWNTATGTVPADSGNWGTAIVRKPYQAPSSPPSPKRTREQKILDLFGISEEINSTGINFDKYDQIPVKVAGSSVPDHITSFSDLQLKETLTANIIRCRYTKPTPIQKYAIPITLARRDLMACAQTGSGKTAAFLVPAIDAIESGRYSKIIPDPETTNNPPAYPSVLVLAPTRELASQIHNEAKKLCFETSVQCNVVYGGQDLQIQIRALNRHPPDIIVATPGRLSDFLTRNKISLCNISLLIFDEADRMLDMGFEPQIRKIVEHEDMPSALQGRQTVMFSATFPNQIQSLAQEFLRDSLLLTVGVVGSTTESITQFVEYAENHQKRELLESFLPTFKGRTIIFVETKRAADMLDMCLKHSGVLASCIHGDRTQDQRETALANFRSGASQILVATDVASRGLDIDNVMYVVNYDVPNNIDDYVHRIGRTGRRGNLGVAITFINESNFAMIRPLYNLFQQTGQRIPPFFESMIASGKFDNVAPQQRFGGTRPQRNNKSRQGGDSRIRGSFSIG